MRTPSAIMAEIAALIAADADIQSYCRAQFSRPFQVLIGIDDDVPPPESRTPFLAMRPGSYVPSSDRAQRPVSVALCIVISETGEDEDWFSEAGGIRTLNALAKIERIYALVETVLEGFISANYNGQAAYGDCQTEITMPLVRLSWSLTFEENIN